MADGRIEPGQVARLKEMGQWLYTNGERCSTENTILEGIADSSCLLFASRARCAPTPLVKERLVACWRRPEHLDQAAQLLEVDVTWSSSQIAFAT